MDGRTAVRAPAVLYAEPGDCLDAAPGPADPAVRQLTRAAQPVHGKLDLAFLRRGDGTRLDIRGHNPPLQVVRAFPAGNAALVYLHNVSGGILGGDRTETKIDVGPGAHAQIKTTGATRMHRGKPGDGPSVQSLRASVAEGGIIEWMPDATIPFAGSSTRIETQIELDSGAGLFWWDIVAPGRIARGEKFAYDRLDFDFVLSAVGRPIAREFYCLEPGIRDPSGPTALGGYAYLVTMYICRVGISPQDIADMEEELRAFLRDRPGDEYWGASALSAHGVVIKGLTQSAVRVPKTLAAVMEIGKRRLYCPPGRPKENRIASDTT